jgi:uncharacterized protein HemX
MERIFRVNNKEFTDEGLALDYENKLKIEQEERAKVIAKAEAERKAKEEKVTELNKKIKEKSKELDSLLDEYEKLSGNKYYYRYTGNEYSFPMLLNEFMNRANWK